MRTSLSITLPFCIFLSTATSYGGEDFLEDLASAIDSTETFDQEESSSFSISAQRIDTEFDFLLSDDIQVNRYSTAYEAKVGDFTLGLSFGYLTHAIDYNPNGSTSPTHRNEETFQGSFSAAYNWNDSLTTNISLSGYEGFTDYRSLWISEFFLQSFGLFPQYEEADPYGWSLSFGNTWNFANGVDRLSLDFGYSRDRIAPGWEIGGIRFNEAESSEDLLETFSGSLRLENYLTNNIKTQQTIRLSQVTDREIRTQARTNWAWSPFNKWTLRAEFGATFEPSDFESYFGGLNAIYQITPELSIDVGYRYYTDSGEITNANFNTAAPALESTEISSSLLWNRGSHAVRLSVGFYQTDFVPSGVENIEFANLFRDRDFFAIRGAYTLTF